MLTNFISDAANAVYSPAFSKPEKGNYEESSNTAIKVNIRSVPAEVPSTEIYDRARKIFYRARNTGRPTRAAGIF
jgi:hypothetical protein